MVQRVVDALLDQTKSIERAVAALDLKSIEFEGSDSLDNPAQGARPRTVPLPAMERQNRIDDGRGANV